MSDFAASPDVKVEIARWLGYLGAERRLSGKTLEAYARDVGQFLSFLADAYGWRTIACANWPSSRRPISAPSWPRGGPPAPATAR